MPAHELRLGRRRAELELAVGPVPPDAAERLASAGVTVLGRMLNASNATFLVRLDGADGLAIYKPGRGERPLWDFEPGLYRREVAAYVLSEAAGLGVVPPTVVRPDAPLGEGSLQWFVNADFAEHYFSLYGERPDLHDQLRAIAVFDAIANNTDRKSGHCLLEIDGDGGGDHVWAIDNGLCFAADDKLRTVIWEFAGEPTARRAAPRRGDAPSTCPATLAALLDDDEIDGHRPPGPTAPEDGDVPGRAAQPRIPLAARVNGDEELDALIQPGRPRRLGAPRRRPHGQWRLGRSAGGSRPMPRGRRHRPATVAGGDARRVPPGAASPRRSGRRR